MSALFGTGKKTQNAVPASSFNVQTSVAGLPIPIILGGRSRMSINLIGYNDFTSIPHYSSGGGKGSLFAGGSSGGKGSSTTSYTYSVAVAMALGEGGIASVEYVWNDKTKQTLDTLNLSTFTGSATQAAWGYMTSLHPNQALAYRGLAYMAAGPLQLGSSTELPNLSFEVTSTNSYVISGLPDADPSTCITRLLTDPNFGIGFGTSRIGDLSAYTAYCRATGMLVSPTITDLTSGQDFIKTLLEATNSEAVWSQGQLRIVPRGDQAVTAGTIIQVTETHTIVPDYPTALSYPGTFGSLISIKNSADGGVYQRAASPNSIPGGYYYPVAPDQFAFAGGTAGTSISITYTYYEPATYTPPTQPVYALGDDDYALGSSGASQPVDITRSAPQDQKNSVVVNFLDRTSAYNLTPTPAAKDDAAIQMYGLRQDSVRDYHFFCYAQAAQQSAQLLLGRNLVRNTYTFTLGQKYVLLDPMDIVSLTDSAAGLVAKWVRITETTENDDLTLTMTAEEYLAGSSAAPLYGQEPNAGYVPNYNQDPGFINAPVIFEPPSTLTSGANELWVGVSGGSTIYGGCDTYVSYDDANYALVPDAHLVGSARTGFLTAALPAGPALDTTNTLAVDISQVPGAQLTSGTMADATNLATLCYVDGELIAYQTATLTALGHYTLGTLVRGCYGTPITAHSAGKPFVRLDMQIVKIPFNKALVNSTIFLKFVPFNLWGQGGQGISAVSPIAYTFGGGQAPGLIVFTNVQFAQSGLAATLVATWGVDGLSASYQSQISQDNGATWTSVLQNTDTTLRVDGLKAVATIVRVRGVTSSGVIGVWASATLGAPAMTSAGSGYSQIISYKDLNPSIVDTVFASDQQNDLNDLASAVGLGQIQKLASTALRAANGAAAAVVQVTAGQLPALTAALATTGINQTLSDLNAKILANTAQELADITDVNGRIATLKQAVDNSSAINQGISAAQANVNAATSLQYDVLATSTGLSDDSGELAAFAAALQTGNAAVVAMRATNAALAGVVSQTYTNTTNLTAVTLAQQTYASSFGNSIAFINQTLTTYASNQAALAGRTTKIESAINDPVKGLSATYQEATATAAVVNDPTYGNQATASSLSGLTTAIYGASGTVASLSQSITNNTNSINNLSTTVSSNYTTLNNGLGTTNAAVSNLSGTVASQGTAISNLSATVSSNYDAANNGLATTNATVSSLSQTVSNQGSAIGSLSATVSSNYNSLNNGLGATNATVSSLSQTVSNQGSSLGSLTTTVKSNYDTLSGAIGATNQNVATNSNSITTLSNQYGALSQQVQTVSAQSAAGTANGQISFVAQSAPTGVTARFAVQIAASGQQPASGGLFLDLVNGKVMLTAQVDTFQIQNSSTRTVPFGIDSAGNTILYTAYIGNAVSSQTSLSNGEKPMVFDFVNGSIAVYDGK